MHLRVARIQARSRTSVRLAVAVAYASFAVALGGPTANAQAPSEADLEVARDLARQGLSALQVHDFATAEDLLSRAIAVHDAPTLRVARARSRDGLGRLTAAAEDYRIAQRWPTGSDDPPAFVRARRDASRELGVLEARIPQLTIELSGGAATVRVAGVTWPASAVGVPRALDPGEYAIDASGPNGEKAQVTVRLAPGDRRMARLALQSPAHEDAVRTSQSAGLASATAPSDQKPAPAPTLESQRASAPANAGNSDEVQHDARAAPQPARESSTPAWTENTGALIVGGVSVAMLIAAIAVGVHASSLKADYAEINTEHQDMQRKEDKYDELVTTQWIGRALLGAAVVGGGVATYMFLSAPTEAEPGPTVASGLVRGFGIQANLAGRF
jgi:hypothetical protein